MEHFETEITDKIYNIIESSSEKKNINTVRFVSLMKIMLCPNIDIRPSPRDIKETIRKILKINEDVKQSDKSIGMKGN